MSEKPDYTLHDFANIALGALSSVTALEGCINPRPFETFPEEFDTSPLISTVSFSGFKQGVFTLILPRPTAVLALSSFMGEVLDLNEEVLLSDGVNELCNIAVGAIKAQLSDANLPFLFSLPSEVTDLQYLKESLEINRGTWFHLTLDEQPLVLHITVTSQS